MSWKEKIAERLVESVGCIGTLDLFPEALKQYLLLNETDAASDPYLIAETYIDVGGFKIFEDKSFRAKLISSLADNSIIQLGEALSISSSDPHVIRARLVEQAWNWNSSYAETFCSYFGAHDICSEAIQCIEKENQPERVLAEIFSSRDQFYELHTYQSQIRDKVLEKLSLKNEQKVLIQLPTGAGKTRVGVHTAIRYILNEKSKKHILWLAYQPLLLKQALETFEEIWPVLGVGPISVGQYYGGINTLYLDADASITFANISVLLGNFNSLKGMLKDKLSLIIFDEAHQAVADNARELITSLTSEDTIKLIGLTATPGRGAGDFHETNRLVQLFEANIVEIDPPVSKSFIGSAEDITQRMQERGSAIRWLQDIGVLAKLEHHLLEVEKEQDVKSTSESDAYSTTLLKAIANDAKRNKVIIDKLIQLNQLKQKVLVFACSVEHAKNLVTILKLKGVKAGLVTGDNTQTRTGILDSFNNSDKLNILINYEVLTTGFDAPIINALLVARPTSSVVTYSQMLGRALRGPLNRGHSKNQIYNIQSPYYGDEIDAYHHFSDYWN